MGCSAVLHSSAFCLLTCKLVWLCPVASMRVSYVVKRIDAVVSAQYRTDTSWLRRCRKRIFSTCTAMIHSELCCEWFAFLDSEPIRPLVVINPALPLKPFKPYLSLGLDIGDRVRVIRDSLSFVAAHWSVLQGFVSGHKSLAATLDLGSDGVFSLFLEFNYQKEGELTLLRRLADSRIAAISAFAFERKPDGTHVMRIARIQGVKDAEMQRRLEKAMFGLRPKSLLLFASQEVAHALGVREIFGICNARQVYLKERRISNPGLPALDYDAFWTEAGGVPDEDGWFRLPSRLEKRAPTEMKTNKRSMYKKRYAMLDEVSRQIQNALGCKTTTPLPMSTCLPLPPSPEN